MLGFGINGKIIHALKERIGDRRMTLGFNSCQQVPQLDRIAFSKWNFKPGILAILKILMRLVAEETHTYFNLRIRALNGIDRIEENPAGNIEFGRTLPFGCHASRCIDYEKYPGFLFLGLYIPVPYPQA